MYTQVTLPDRAPHQPFGRNAEEEVWNGVYSLELQSLHRHQNEVPLQG